MTAPAGVQGTLCGHQSSPGPGAGGQFQTALTLGKARMWPAMGSTDGGRATVPRSGDNVDGRRAGQEAGPDPQAGADHGGPWRPLRPTAGRERASWGGAGSSHDQAFWVTGADRGTSPRKDGREDARTVTGTSLNRNPRNPASPRPVSMEPAHSISKPGVTRIRMLSPTGPRPPVAAVLALPVGPPTHSQRSGGCPTPLLPQAQPAGLCHRRQATGWGPTGVPTRP